MICECGDGKRVEQYDEPDIHWASWGVPEGISCYYVCMVCDKSWVERYWWGRDAVVCQEEQT
jgi:hypothetical protein